MTSVTVPLIQYTVGRQVACSFFHETSWMFTNAFNEVDWLNVYCTLKGEVPRLFQVWACKQEMNIAATNKNSNWCHHDGSSDKCPCCTFHVETAEQIIPRPAVGRVEAFMQASQALEQWLEESNMDQDLIDCIVDYVQGQGTLTMASAVQNAPP